LLLVALFLATIVGVFAAPSTTAQAASCITSNVDAYDMGGGLPWNPNYVVDVYDVSNTDGYFLYWNPFDGSWEGVSFKPWYGINRGAGVRWGVSTFFALTHPYWESTSWRYVYPC
jgi:hypothetical protein